MSKPWGGRGSWAAEAEQEEAEERKAMEAAAAAEPTAESQSFPSLKEAVSTKPRKKKFTLSEFNTGFIHHPEAAASRCGSGPSAGRGMRERDGSDGSWGSGRRPYGGFDEERRGPPSRVSDYDQPSRADEVDNWAMAKKTAPSFDSSRQNRYGGLGTGGGGGNSKADEVDNWTAGKQSIPARASTFGSGFRDTGPEPDRWTRSGGGFREERPRLVLNPPRGEVNEPSVKTIKPNPFGAARPREEVLMEKGLDWKKLDSDIESKKVTSRPTSSHSSRPSSAQSSRSEGPQLQGIENVVKPRPKVNPFGDAKPREVLLEERGKDWRKIDLELERRWLDSSGSAYCHEFNLACDISGALTFRVYSLKGLNIPYQIKWLKSLILEHRAPLEAWSRPADDRRGFQGGYKGGRDRGFLGNRDLDGQGQGEMMIVWIRLPGLPYRYYTKFLFQLLASEFEKVIKVDYNTNVGEQRKFARFCGGCGPEQPLLPCTAIDDKVPTNNFLSILKGLPKEYQSFVAIITTIKESLSLDRIYSRLIDSKTQLVGFNVLEESLPMSADLAHANPGTKSTSHGYHDCQNTQHESSSGGRTGGKERGHPRFLCQLCGSSSYSSLEAGSVNSESCSCCAKGRAEVQVWYQLQPQAHVTTAAHLVTPDFCAMLILSSLDVNYLLHVPKITKNLLSVSKLVRDNMFFEFHASHCCVRDKTVVQLCYEKKKGMASTP
ncbi:V-type proton ATPase subunit G3-like [Hibiscus syriacus]|uniref:V-type proton ATPase subunit G3-like n=1 Tax=Hibiscus syriacus TaxID=106335 RepID=A0A6A2WUW6_HIBSY|nr:V-type proton ATPase subunit G3-like [Hibiscus syriacus]